MDSEQARLRLNFLAGAIQAGYRVVEVHRPRRMGHQTQAIGDEDKNQPHHVPHSLLKDIGDAMQYDNSNQSTFKPPPS